MVSAIFDQLLLPSPAFYLREGNGTPLQYSCQENLMDRGACRTTVYGAKKSQAQLND